jgi:formylglycine-generating enzyme required for sulfatase activity
MENEPIQSGEDRDELLAALMELRRELCQRSFDPGLQRVLAARDLLLEMAVAGGPADPARWESWLAPLFCANEKQQEQFHDLFQRWILRHRQLFANRSQLQPVGAAAERAVDPERSVTPDSGTEVKPHRRAGWRWNLPRSRWLLAGGGLLLMLALAAGFWLRQTRTVTLVGMVTDRLSGKALAGAVVSLPDQTQRQTGSDGRYSAEFRLTNLRVWRSPKIEISASHPDYVPASDGRILSWFGGEGPIQVDLALQPQGETLPLEPSVVEPGATPTQKTTPTPPPPPPPRLSYWKLLLILSPLLLWLVWQLLALMLRTWWLQRVSSRVPPDLRTLPIEDPALELFASPKEQRLLVELRRPRPLDLHDLNLPATVRETARSGGLFTPSYQRLRSSPEYLLLIDQQNVHDELAQVGVGLLESLDRNGVYVEPFTFQGDPRLCQSLKRNAEDEPPVTLRYLAGRYPDHRLLVVSDAEGFYDSSTGRPRPWLELLEPWNQRSLLTPKPADRWGFREEGLRQRQFSLLPLTPEGLRLLGEMYNYGQLPQPEIRSTTPFPASIADRPERWLDRVEPEEADVRGMLAEVEGYLGADGYVWMCACAIYPEMIWELTECYGYWLLAGTPEWTDQRAELILRLVRLPWFRQGYMPEWLRMRLINHLGRPELRQRRDLIRDHLEKLLLTAAKRPDKIVALEIAAPIPQTVRQQANGFLRRLAMKLRIIEEGEREPLRDYVFLSFMTGRRVKPTGVRLPELLQRLFFRDGKPWLGLRPVVTLLAAALISGGLALAWWRTSPVDPARQPGLEVPQPPVPTDSPIPTPVNASTPTPTPTPGLRRPAPSPPRNAPGPEAPTGSTSALPGEGTGPSTTPGTVVSTQKTATGYLFTLAEGVTLEVVFLSGGKFRMGSEKGFDSEKPVHEVTVKSFHIGRTEVTQEQWRAVMGSLPNVEFKGDKRPVERISWFEAREFCRKLSELTGYNFRLPTEAEWEYAARGGTTTEYSFGDDASKLGEYAWFRGNSNGQTQPVATRLPNPFGLFDMHGNVWEWVEDHWHDNYEGAPTDGSAWLTGDNNAPRVLRGGSSNYYDFICRSAYRYYFLNDSFLNDGLRVVVGAQTQPER